MRASVNRGFDLEHPVAGSLTAPSWAAAMLGHHHSAMMQVAANAGASGSVEHSYGHQGAGHHVHSAIPGSSTQNLPVDLHMPQGFPYYRLAFFFNTIYA